MTLEAKREKTTGIFKGIPPSPVADGLMGASEPVTTMLQKKSNPSSALRKDPKSLSDLGGSWGHNTVLFPKVSSFDSLFCSGYGSVRL